jgi:hypothetical protein
MTLEVDDLDAAHATLKSAIADGVGDIETWDMGEFGTTGPPSSETPMGRRSSSSSSPRRSDPTPASLG